MAPQFQEVETENWNMKDDIQRILTLIISWEFMTVIHSAAWGGSHISQAVTVCC